MRALASVLDSIRQDVRHGARLLWRSPVFTLVSVGSLALGLGGAVGLFTVMNAVVFRPLAGREAASVHLVQTSNREGERPGASSWTDFEAFARQPGLFAAACATTNVRGTLAVDDAAHVVSGALFGGSCFHTFGIRAETGRLLGTADDASGRTGDAVVISYALWRRGFGMDPSMIGRSALLNGAPVTIVGVAEPGFAGVSLDASADFWVSPQRAGTLMSPETLTSAGERRFRIFARLAEGVTTAEAEGRLLAVADAGTRVVSVRPEREVRFAGSSGVVAATTLAAVAGIALLLLVACVNLATMTMARGAGRTRELNVRLAIGASRRRVLRQLATESLLVSAAGAAAGVGIVAAGLRLFDAFRPEGIPAFSLVVDWRVAVAAGALAAIAPVLFGLAPGVHTLRLAIADGMRERKVARRWLGVGAREALIAVQLAACFALFVMASLFMRSLGGAHTATAAPAAAGIVVVPVELNSSSQPDADASELTDRLLRAAVAVPGVRDVTAAGIVPLTGSYIGIAGRNDAAIDAPEIVMDGNMVAPGYFELLGIARRSGRTFDAGDHAGAPAVAIVSESLARRLWNSTAVTGQLIALEDGPATVVGVVADAPYRSTTGEPQPVIYLPLAQSPRERFVLHARADSPAVAAAGLTRVLRTVDARMLIGAAVPLERFLDRVNDGPRAAQWAGSAAGLLQLGLALMATWGLVVYAVQRRRREIAVRRALGASDGSVVRLILTPSVVLLVAGGLAGTVAGIGAARVLHASFIGLAPINLTMVVPVALALAVVVVLASWLPARRAVADAPAAQLRAE